ncbi:MAG: hypothetical protein Q7S22_07050 [Candidatus Micrarchaeota archaeon]|nr:hypothetical protein [Candidatus Micrarchaeota archaeon]
MKELYSEIITDPSLKELEEFALWYNEKIGNYSIIVGGWAVYFYTKGLGSKDIDVVFMGDKTKHVTLFDYFRSHGYVERSRSFFDKEFVKPVKTKLGDVEIIVDAVSSNRTIIFDGKKARLPWSWAVKHSNKHKVGKTMIYIPTIELLIVYKLGAVLGRNINLKTGLDFDYYKSKLWKDVYDIVSLSQLKVDSEKVNSFLKDSGLDLYKDEILQIMEDNFDDESRSLLKNNSLDKIKGLLG